MCTARTARARPAPPGDVSSHAPEWQRGWASGSGPEDEEGEGINSLQHPVIMKRLLRANDCAIGVEHVKGLGRGVARCKGNRTQWQSLGGARAPTRSIPNLRAHRSRALRSPERSWHAHRARTSRTRARSGSPRRRGSAPRARTRGLPCASPPFATCRMVRRQQLQRGVGGGGEGEAAPRSGGGAAAGGRGRSWGERLGESPGRHNAPPSLPLFSVAPFCKAITAVPLFLALASGNTADQKGFHLFTGVCLCPRPPEPKLRKNHPPFLSQSHSQAFV